MIKIYDSVSDLAQEFIRLGKPKLLCGSSSLSWYGGETVEQTIDFAQRGDTKLVDVAESLMTKLETQIETPRRTWTASPVGAYPCVPDYLRNIPTSMRRQVETGDEHAQITILVCTSSSASISSEVFLNRGITILTLVMALSRVRPVSLYLLDISDGNRDTTGETVFLTKINTTPLDLATAAYAVTSIGLTRRVMYSIEQELNGFDGGWPKNFNFSNPKQYYTKLLNQLGFDEKHTLLIEAARSNDQLLTQPLSWIKSQIERFVTKDKEQ